jgi:membrane protein
MGTAAELHDQVQPQPDSRGISAYVERLNQLAKHEPFYTLRRTIDAFNSDKCTLWASALTYTTSLSLVPILAVALSTVKGLVGMDRIKPLIAHYLAANSPQMADQLLSFVGNINAKQLGTMGGAALLVTVVLTLGTIEQSFNNIFHVERGRTWLRKFSDYLSVIFTMPLLLAAAIGLNTELMHKLPTVPGLAKVAALVPVWAGFSFLYVFFPNTRVRLQSAAIGGLVAAVMLQVGQWGFLRFQVGAGKYQAIYGAVASVPILLTWIYISWVIVLLGAVLTAALQGIEGPLELDQHSPNIARVAALLTVQRAGERMLQGKGARSCTALGLASELGVGQKVFQTVLAKLVHAGIVMESAEASADHTPQIVLARDTSAIPLTEVLACIDDGALRGGEEIAALIDQLSEAEREKLGTLTVNDLATGRLTLSRSFDRSEPREVQPA